MSVDMVESKKFIRRISEPLKYQIEQEPRIHRRIKSSSFVNNSIFEALLVTVFNSGDTFTIRLMSAQEVQDFYMRLGPSSGRKVYSGYYGSQGLLYYLLTT